MKQFIFDAGQLLDLGNNFLIQRFYGGFMKNFFR